MESKWKPKTIKVVAKFLATTLFVSFCVILTHFVPLLVAKVEAKTTCEIYEQISEHLLTRLDAYSPNGYS